jgi:tape measure domain-containing protein
MANPLARLIVEMRSNTAHLEQGIARTEKRFKILGKGVKSAQNTLLAFGGAAGLGFIINKGLTLADTFNVLQARIKNATKETGDYARVSEELGRIAGETGAQLDTTVDVFQRLSQSRKELGATNTDLLQLTESVQQLGVISGASTTAMTAGLLQFGQGLSAGIFRAEEFNSIVENMPALANTLAKSLGKTNGELRAMVLEGKLLSKDVMEAVLSQADDINQQFNEMPVSMARAGVALDNSFAKFLSSLDQSIEGTKTLASVMGLVTESLDGWSERLTESTLDELTRKRVSTMIRLQAVMEQGLTAAAPFVQRLIKQIDDLDVKIIEANKNLLAMGVEETETVEPVAAKSVLGIDSDKIQKELEKLQKGLMSAEELENQRFARALENLKLARELELESTRSFDELEVELAQQHNNKLAEIEEAHWSKVIQMRESSLTALQRFEVKSFKDKTATIVGEMVRLTQGVAQSSKTMFKINKIAGIANAVINTAQGVTQALAAYPPPLSFAMAALQGAAGIAQIQAIKSTSFGGGGSAPSVAGTGPGATTQNVFDITPQSQQPAGGTLTVRLDDISGRLLSEAAMRQLLSEIEETRVDMGDNTRVIYA